MRTNYGEHDGLKCDSENYYALLDFLQDYLGNDWEDFKDEFEKTLTHKPIK